MEFSRRQDESLQKIIEAIQENIETEDKFLVTFHVVKGKKLNNFYSMHEFPNGDLLPTLKYLEDEFVKLLKKSVTGNGRM